MVVEQVVVATEEDASVTWSIIEYVPGFSVIVCVVEVAPLLHKNVTGDVPPVEEAVHVIMVDVELPAHEADNVEAIATIGKAATISTPARDKKIFFILFI